MDALMAALVAAALAQVGDPAPHLAAVLADRWKRPGTVILAAFLALNAAGLLAAFAGHLLAPMLTPEAKLLLLALALALQGGGALFPPGKLDRLAGWKLGAFATAFAGLFILSFGDGIQFVAAALAARSPMPWLAGVGAALGSLAVVAPAALAGEEAWTRLPLRPVRLMIAVLFLLAAAMLALEALGLV